jgi:hypothetical protein
MCNAAGSGEPKAAVRPVVGGAWGANMRCTLGTAVRSGAVRAGPLAAAVALAVPPPGARVPSVDVAAAVTAARPPGTPSLGAPSGVLYRRTAPPTGRRRTGAADGADAGPWHRSAAASDVEGSAMPEPVADLRPRRACNPSLRTGDPSREARPEPRPDPSRGLGVARGCSEREAVRRPGAERTCSQCHTVHHHGVRTGSPALPWVATLRIARGRNGCRTNTRGSAPSQRPGRCAARRPDGWSGVTADLSRRGIEATVAHLQLLRGGVPGGGDEAGAGPTDRVGILQRPCPDGVPLGVVDGNRCGACG